MKKFISLLFMAALLAACGTETAEPEIPSLEGLQESAMHEPDGVVEDPEPDEQLTIEEPEETTPFISVEEAEQAARNAIDPNDEFNYYLEFHNSWRSEIDAVNYFSGHWRSSPGGEFLGMLYVDRLTSEVFLNVNGKLMTLPLDELTEILLFVERFNSMNFWRNLPAFDHINEIPVEYIVKIFDRGFRSDMADFEYTEEQLMELSFQDNRGYHGIYGIYPSTIEKYIQEKYNPDFRIGNYDFSFIDSFQDWNDGNLWLGIGREAVWDAERGALLLISYESAGGGSGSGSYVLKIEQDGDVFHVITADTWASHGIRGVDLEDFFLQIVEKSENGGFIMVSKETIDINTVSFTEEELNSSWIFQEIYRDGRFILTQREATEIAKGILDGIVFADEIVWGKPYIDGDYFGDNYYTAAIWREGFYGWDYEENYFGSIYVNALTGEAYFEPSSE